MRFLAIFSFIALIACSQQMNSNPKTEKEFIQKIQQLEQDVLKQSIEGDTTNLDLKDSLAATLESFVKTFPKSKDKPLMLDKLQMLYSSQGLYQLAILKTEQLIREFPSYPNRMLVIESQIANYEFFIQPRDTEKIKFYIELLLKEQKLSKEKKEQYKKRLKNIDRPIEEIILSK